jgi:hypothetical protein
VHGGVLADLAHGRALEAVRGKELPGGLQESL